ncbi:MAG: ATP-grasp domain-containing protein [Planctomycetota bacterium]
MRKLRVLVLMHKHLVPPESNEGLSEEQIALTHMERKVLSTLKQLGHEARALGLEDELGPIRPAIEEFKPHVAFNMLTYFHDVASYEAHVVSYLELLKQPYTGCNPRGLVLAGDKALSKKILSYHRIPCPQFALFPQGGRRARLPARMRYPVIVKSVIEQGSAGIAQASVVKDDDSLNERVEFLHRTLSTDAVAEQFIDGRELTISVLGNERLQTFPVWELWFDKLPERSEAIATSRVKWNEEYAKRIGAHTGRARELDPVLEKRLLHVAKRTYKALDLSGYARIDLRLDAEGRAWVLEANPNPDLTPGEDFPESAKSVGLNYAQLVQRLLNLGIGYKSAWKVE